MMKAKELGCTIFGFVLAIIAFMAFNSYLPQTVNTETFTNMHESSINFEEIAHWANNIPALKAQDEKRSSILSPFMKKYYKIEKPAEEEVREIFYQFLSQPLQTVCHFPKKIGGIWLNQCAWLDGDKHVCMDLLKDAIDKGECLIYSFGLASDWTFEHILANMGCTVRALDPTVIQEPENIHDNIHFKQIGISHESGQSEVVDGGNDYEKSLVDVLTLEDTIKSFGDEGKTIHYLKVDVEGHELKAIHNWLDSGILAFVQQIGLELHTGYDYIEKTQTAETLYQILKTLKEMEDKYRFKLIDYKSNGCVGKDGDVIGQLYHTFFDIVLMKEYE